MYVLSGEYYNGDSYMEKADSVLGIYDILTDIDQAEYAFSIGECDADQAIKFSSLHIEYDK